MNNRQWHVHVWLAASLAASMLVTACGGAESVVTKTALAPAATSAPIPTSGPVIPTAAPTVVPPTAPAATSAPVATAAPAKPPVNSPPGYHAPLAANSSLTSKSGSEYPGSTITILGITDNAKNCNSVFNPKDKRCLVIQIEGGNSGTRDSFPFSSNGFRLRDTQDFDYEGNLVDEKISGHNLGSIRIGPGGKVKGDVAFVIPKDAKVKWISHKATLDNTNQTFYFDAP